ncbi:MAG: endolytic transglycosylase MltG [Saprospiraceae bacterium]|nr:endolytic transglycosylase MltG [Saprospiraceae bacterium]
MEDYNSFEDTPPEQEIPKLEERPKKKGKKRKWILGIFLVLLLAGGAVAFYLYNQVMATNVELKGQDRIVQFPSGSSLEQIADILHNQQILKDKGSFLFTASLMSYKGKTGQYKLPKGTKNNRELIQILRGKQNAVKVTFNNIRKIDQLAPLVALNLEMDSLDLYNLLANDSYIEALGYSRQTIIALFIPNTYNFYWTTTPREFMQRMEKENKKFWATEKFDGMTRQARADSLGLTPIEVYTLASIVETETQHNPEKKRIAGVYMNRLIKNWKLQADPTVVFALDDFSIRRVLLSHTEHDSPYNTYMYEGLPPGPIYMSSIASIDAVLDYEKHDYMYFCANPEQQGTHAFAKTLAGHNANARRYHSWVRRQNF